MVIEAEEKSAIREANGAIISAAVDRLVSNGIQPYQANPVELPGLIGPEIRGCRLETKYSLTVSPTPEQICVFVISNQPEVKAYRFFDLNYSGETIVVTATVHTETGFGGLGLGGGLLRISEPVLKASLAALGLGGREIAYVLIDETRSGWTSKYARAHDFEEIEAADLVYPRFVKKWRIDREAIW